MWDELPLVTSDEKDKNRASRASRTGYVKLTFNFLQEQKLFIAVEDRYYPTDRFHAIVENYFEETKEKSTKYWEERQMPSINRIRVNNVKYNFGTQYYDDFTMRMYGKNTLYDLANGGGKSVLMLLLMQNMIPNCTLDEKQPIEKLFRTGNGNTTIHSLVEWKLDEQDRKEGYRYMTTGFCARKAKDVEGETAKKDVAAIEYFNYCIFYREYNKNDIINLPLSKDKERITFQGLRNYLKELEHRDMSLKVCIFDRKGEYQRFISGYGLHESQWEIIRGINKTEGHVRTYSRRIIRRRERSWRIC